MHKSIPMVGLLVVTAFALGACGDDDTTDTGDAGDATTTVAESVTTVAATTTATDAATTTVPATTTVAVDTTCGGVDGLGGALMDVANLNSPVEGIEFLVTEVYVSADDASWGRGQVSAPPDSGVEGFIGVAHCEDLGEGLAWNLRDMGTSGVGCAPEVPDDLAFDC